MRPSSDASEPGRGGAGSRGGGMRVGPRLGPPVVVASRVPPAEDERGVLTAEAERVREPDPQRVALGDVRREIETLAGVIGIDGG